MKLRSIESTNRCGARNVEMYGVRARLPQSHTFPCKNSPVRKPIFPFVCDQLFMKLGSFNEVGMKSRSMVLVF